MVGPPHGTLWPCGIYLNWRLLVFTGFLLVSDGLVDTTTETTGSYAGVEEAATISALQKMLRVDNARAKLVRVSGDGVQCEQDFSQDSERKAWHEKKMQSKLERASVQLNLLGLKDYGIVEHC
jgi:hypothetical protein